VDRFTPIGTPEVKVGENGEDFSEKEDDAQKTAFGG